MNLKVDDEYCNEVADYYRKYGEKINNCVNEYVIILKEIKKEAIKKGNVADALESYISYSKKMNGKFLRLAKDAQKYTKKYVEKIDDADQYLF